MQSRFDKHRTYLNSASIAEKESEFAEFTAFFNEVGITKDEPNAQSAPLNAGMMINIHVSLAWMPVKAL